MAEARVMLFRKWVCNDPGVMHGRGALCSSDLYGDEFVFRNRFHNPRLFPTEEIEV